MKPRMTESEWMTSQDSYPMLHPCRSIIRNHPRKGRLFAVACCNRIRNLLTDARSRTSVEIAARYTDGLTTQNELIEAAEAARLAHSNAFKVKGKTGACAEWAAQFAASPDAWLAASRSSNFAYVAAGDGLEPGPEHAAQSDLLRCVFGPLPFRQIARDPNVITGAVTTLATAIYDDQEFGRMPELADELETAGCRDADILGHCRSKSPHVRGCWVIDLLLNRK